MRKKGMILICTLAIMVILSIFLMTAVHQMQSSTMVTKKAMWDIKSYWSALAGSTIASDGCIRDYRWPEEGLLENAGGYNITIGNNGVVTAVDNDSDSKVNIYYKSKLLNTAGHESNPPTEETLSEYFNQMQLHTQAKNSDEEKEKGEIYCLSVGKSGPTVVGLEFVYGLYYNPNLFGQFIGNGAVTENTMGHEASISAAGAIYVKRNLEADVKEFFKVKQENGTRGYIVVGGNVDINNKDGVNSPPNSDGNGPVQLAEGAIFMGGNIVDPKDRTCLINGTKIEPDNNSNITNYGIAVYTSPTIEIQQPTLVELGNKISLPAGMFCFVEMPNEYEQKEFDGTIDALFDVSLNLEEFYDIYCKDLFHDKQRDKDYTNNLINNYNTTLSTNSFSESDINKFNTKFNTYFQKYESNIKQKERQQEGGIFAFLYAGTENLESIKNLYRCYLLAQCSSILGAYKNSEGSKYESFFIPNGNAGINENNEEITLEYEIFAKARALGDIAKKIRQNSEGFTNSSAGFITYLYMNEQEKRTNKTKEEYEKIKNHFKEHRTDSNFPYIAEEVNLGTHKKCFVLNKFSEYVDEVINSSNEKFTAKAQEIATVLEHVTFESDHVNLIMSINDCNLESNSSFKFATFERKDKYTATTDIQMNSTTTTETTSSLYLPKTEYIANQSIPVETMTKFLKLFITPVMARQAAQEMTEPQEREASIDTETDDPLPMNHSGTGAKRFLLRETELEAPSAEVIEQMMNENPNSDYFSAINRRAAIRLGNPIEVSNEDGTTSLVMESTNNSITAKNINIKGFIYGTGHIATTGVGTQGDIKFEAVGSGVDSTEENWVSIWSNHDIIINRVSATKSIDYGENADLSTSDFRGILYSRNDLKVDVGTDNLDFTVSGAIICGNDMKMTGIRNLKVEYDPSLSSLILSKYIADWNSGSEYIIQTFNDHNNNEDTFLSTGKFKMFNRI